MPDQRRIHFAPFALDLIDESLWSGPRQIKLRPKAYAVLEQLLSRPGQLVTKEHLLGAVWEGTFVGDAVLKVAIRQIREALADDPKSPRFIETAHRRGYRFIGTIDIVSAVTVQSPDRSPEAPPPFVLPASPPSGSSSERGFVGRGAALARLDQGLARTVAGERHVVFVTGEAGLGKTTLLEAFARSIDAGRQVRVCSGQCLEQYGMTEAYLPVFDALRQLCREDATAVDALRVHAPTWLLQMPSLLTETERDRFGRETTGATRERMLREMGDALEVLTAVTPLVLVLEDLHWSDVSTLDLISYVARRTGPAHLMVVGTYRPAELIARGHPLKAVKQELLVRQRAVELPLDYLDESAIAEHLRLRYPAHRFPSALAAVIHERTEGNPLFMVNTLDYLTSERVIEPVDDGWQLTASLDAVRVGVPDSIRGLVETQLDRLDANDQRMLEAASVAGAEFSAAAVAAALAADAVEIDTRCEQVSRRQLFIRDCGAQRSPNGEIGGRYAFGHAMYRHVLYDRLSASRRMLLHRRLGEYGESAARGRETDVAAELAMHFERAADHLRAAHYLQLAARVAIERSAFREAIDLSRRGLELLSALSDTDHRRRQQLRLQLTLGVPLIATRGYADAEVGALYAMARDLCDRLEAPHETAQVLWGQWTFHTLKAELSTALGIATEFLRLAADVRLPGVAMRGHWAMLTTHTHLGQFVPALDHLEHALTLYDRERHQDDGLIDAEGLIGALHAGITLRSFGAWSFWFTGAPDRAVAVATEAVTLARERGAPHSLAHALTFAAIVHQLRREPESAHDFAAAAMTLSTEHGLVLYEAMATIVHGWSRACRNHDAAAVNDVRRGLAAWQSTGAQLMCPHYLALLAEALDPERDDGEGLRLLNEAISRAEATGEESYKAELYRLKADRLAASSDAARSDQAISCYQDALATARRQQARSLELRAAVSLARLQLRAGRPELVRGLVLRICEQFPDSCETPDLRDARTLLAAHPQI